MANWRYEGLDRGGASSSGTVVAPDRGTAMRMVLARGLTPLRLDSDEPAPAAAARRTSDSGAGTEVPLPAWMRLTPARPTMGKAELANLIRELATAVEAGLPLMQALRTVRRQAGGKAQSAEIGRAHA